MNTSSFIKTEAKDKDKSLSNSFYPSKSLDKSRNHFEIICTKKQKENEFKREKYIKVITKIFHEIVQNKSIATLKEFTEMAIKFGFIYNKFHFVDLIKCLFDRIKDKENGVTLERVIEGFLSIMKLNSVNGIHKSLNNQKAFVNTNFENKKLNQLINDSDYDIFFKNKLSYEKLKEKCRNDCSSCYVPSSSQLNINKRNMEFGSKIKNRIIQILKKEMRNPGNLHILNSYRKYYYEEKL